jgi:hypothetical protein
MKIQQDFLLSATLAAAVATSALGQVAPPADRSASGADPQSAASIPDFSGIRVHPSLPGFEPPLSGPGPVRNRSRRPDGQSNFNQLVGDYGNPILKPHAAEIVKKHGEISLTGVTYPTPSNQCWPGGVPYMFWNIEMQMLQQPRQVTILYWSNQEVRRVRMNQSHPTQVTPSWYGDSVGHYEGDTLVIDTVGVKADRPFAMVDMYGTPFSPALHVVERYRLLDYDATKAAADRDARENFQLLGGGDAGAVPDRNYRGKGLQLHFIVEDDGVFTMPWSATITYRRGLGPWREYVCAENRREYYNKKESEVPTAHKPDF